MPRHAEPAQANLWLSRSPLHHMQLLPTTAVTRYQACTRRVSPHLRASPAQIQVRSSGPRGHAGTLSYPDRRTRKGKPSSLLQILKQTVARRLLKPARRRRSNQPMLWKEGLPVQNRHFWQARFYDFNVYSNEKRFEKLRYMHRNSVKRGLVSSPELWPWSSFRAYMYAEPSENGAPDW